MLLTSLLSVFLMLEDNIGSAKMTSQERLLAAIRHEEPDNIRAYFEAGREFGKHTAN